MVKTRDTAASMTDVIEEQGNMALSNAQEERIFVSIRVRPLNEREKARHDVSDWECISGNTIRYKNNGHAEPRPLSMDTYAFDRVFGEKCNTKQVYEQGIKEVALSVVRGINSSIFAYGQTSSGKTHTMSGITEYALRDIYEYIEKHKDREFVVKFSAMEIYNEAVRDLLNAGATSLRILDDPEKGTVVEKLTEETLTERRQLQQLLSICAAERTTEETAMNETSSRSHQILRLTVESNPRDYADTARSGALFASVNFVDLAGSERASQAMSAGTRLREGSHINRSLLSLGTVIRKLSKGRNEHIPYRDSKLTRILQNSLGGNARTAIICTISPARSQSEQSRNTLLFASCAKQVTTNAQVNLVMSDKVLVKQLQNELARLENELRSFTPNTMLLKERELRIQQMEKEIKELTRQRDLFQSRAENMVQSVGKDRLLRGADKDSASESTGVANDLLRRTDSASESLDRTTSSLLHTANSEEDFLLDGNSPTFAGPDPCHGWEEMTTSRESEDNYKEVPCIEIKEVETEHKTDVNNTPPIPVSEENGGNTPMIQVVNVNAKSSSGNEPIELTPVAIDNTQGALQGKTEESLQNTKDLAVDITKKSNGSSESEPRISNAMSPPQIDKETSTHPQISSNLEQNESPRFNKLDQESASPPRCDVQELKTTLPPQLDKPDSTSLVCFEDKLPESKLQAAKRNSSRKYSPIHYRDASVEDVESLWDSDAEDTASVLNFVGRMNKRAKQKAFNKDMDDIMVRARTSGINKRVNKVIGVNFERQQRDTIQLWDACNIPLVHRSYFFLLIKGELADSVYFDVELRRLSFLKDTFFSTTNIAGHVFTLFSLNSLMSLNRERKMLSKQVHKKFTRKEREELYVKWGIDLRSKHRSVQLAWRLWTNTEDLNHVRESAALVAKLVGFINSGDAPKKIFGFGFLARRK
ncbi:Kinesin-related protein 11 [Glycine soja]|nr:Kinesin-related protein 11 [Glycine soja]